MPGINPLQLLRQVIAAQRSAAARPDGTSVTGYNADETLTRGPDLPALDAGPAQEREDAWIMEEARRGRRLPGLYPMNAETRARYDRKS